MDIVFINASISEEHINGLIWTSSFSLVGGRSITENDTPRWVITCWSASLGLNRVTLPIGRKTTPFDTTHQKATKTKTLEAT
jgi:hypothetical protein